MRSLKNKYSGTHKFKYSAAISINSLHVAYILFVKKSEMLNIDNDFVKFLNEIKRFR